MINEPIILTSSSFQLAWLEGTKRLAISHWEMRNLVVHIRNPDILDEGFHNKISAFAQSEGLLGPKHVAYTIFPHRLYQNKGNAAALFNAYNKSEGLYDKLHRRKRGWGTYFRRMTNYKGTDGVVNQLDNIITAIRNRESHSKAAYTVVIQNPGGETVRPLGGPCLNYVAVQIEPEQSTQMMILGLLAVYRNHDFLERAYGNYWGLCNLLVFLAKEVNGIPGPLTCVSSHAYVAGRKTAIKTLIEGL
jgi:hypothetical protein